MLYVPGNDMRKINKAPKVNADAIILDLEDSVPVDEKETARIFIKDSIETIAASGKAVYVRINGKDTGFLKKDLEAIIRSELSGIVLPKSESKDDIQESANSIEELEDQRGIESGSISIIPLIETAKGIINLASIASAHERIIALMFGAVDYTSDLSTEISKEGLELLYARSKMSNTCRALGIQAIDTPWIEITDKDGLTQDSKLAKQLGFDGKQAIHPEQLETINQVFSPSEEKIEFYKKVVEVFEEAEGKGLGAASLEGKMIDVATYKQAQSILAQAREIAERERG